MTYYGLNHTDAFQTVPPVQNDVTDVSGKVRILSDSFTSTGAIAINEKIYMGKLPIGAKVVDVILAATDLGTVGTLSVGYEYVEAASGASDDDAFLNDVNVNSAASTTRMSGQVNMVGFLAKMAGEAYVVIHASAATDAAGTIKLCVEYTLD